MWTNMVLMWEDTKQQGLGGRLPLSTRSTGTQYKGCVTPQPGDGGLCLQTLESLCTEVCYSVCLWSQRTAHMLSSWWNLVVGKAPWGFCGDPVSAKRWTVGPGQHPCQGQPSLPHSLPHKAGFLSSVLGRPGPPGVLSFIGFFQKHSN